MSSDEPVGHLRSFSGFAGWLIGGLAVAWIAFHIVTAGVGMLPNYQQRAVHLGALCFCISPLPREPSFP